MLMIMTEGGEEGRGVFMQCKGANTVASII